MAWIQCQCELARLAKLQFQDMAHLVPFHSRLSLVCRPPPQIVYNRGIQSKASSILICQRYTITIKRDKVKHIYWWNINGPMQRCLGRCRDICLTVLPGGSCRKKNSMNVDVIRDTSNQIANSLAARSTATPNLNIMMLLG